MKVGGRFLKEKQRKETGETALIQLGWLPSEDGKDEKLPLAVERPTAAMFVFSP